MDTATPTYTRSQAMTALGIKSSSTFHHLRKKYPGAFVIVEQGHGRTHPTLYDRKALNTFIQWRKVREMAKQFQVHAPHEDK